MEIKSFKIKNRLLLSAIALSLAVPYAASANNGYFLIGFGAKSRGMGGVGIAYGQDGLAAGANPATMLQVDTGRFDIGGELFFPDRAVIHQGVTIGDFKEESDGHIFLLPSMGGISKLSKDFAWGVAVVGAGLGTSYNQTPRDPCPSTYFFNVSCGATNNHVGVSLMQMQILPSAAFRINEHNSIGFSVAMATQVFRAYGLSSFVDLGYTSSNTALTDNGPDWSYGLGWRLGWLGQYLDNKLSLGIDYNARVNMSKFNRYSGLFAQGGDFDIPENFGVGLAYKVASNTDVAFDVTRIKYSDVASVGNPGPNAFDSADFNPLCPGPDSGHPECQLGGELGLGFGWRDQTVYKLGVNHKLNEHHTIRAGWNHAKAPVPPDQVLFNMLAPGVVEDTLTLGYTYVTDKDWLTSYFGGSQGEITMTYNHGFKNTVKGQTMFYPGGGGAPRDGSTNAAISLVIDTLGISYGIKF